MSRTRITVGIAVVVFCANVWAGELKKLHETREDREVELLKRGEDDDHLHGITEIGLERTGCLGTCPVYTVIIKSDGTFRYHGERYVKREGDFTGRVANSEFTRLARFIREAGYAELKDEYDDPHTDGPTAYTKVATASGFKVVRNCDNSGPPKLWAIEELIDKLLMNAVWDEPATRPASAKTQKKP
jgi:hypothetical protein